VRQSEVNRFSQPDGLSLILFFFFLLSIRMKSTLYVVLCWLLVVGCSNCVDIYSPGKRLSSLDFPTWRTLASGGVRSSRNGPTCRETCGTAGSGRAAPRSVEGPL
jgi:hypothetical protein